MQAGVRSVALLLRGLAEVRETASHQRLPLVKHHVQPVVGQLDEDEEDGDGGAVDAQGHGGWGQGLWSEERVVGERQGRKGSSSNEEVSMGQADTDRNKQT